MDTFTVGTALATGRRRRDPAAVRLWRRLLPRLAASPDAVGAVRELRANPRNRAAGLVLGDEIARVLDADPDLLRLALAVVGGATEPTAAAA
ncbi:hypothetical protein [Pseudonocardia lacus]|uniref:hypothetical protein n=1 Tax=Pseudonocardia lacus TaxID=2835865 RepID=UPI001BDBE635|nr:hypothetical protein [Pseudonocardia lacus]